MPMRIAVFTMAFNEVVFLPLWLEHYGRQFGHENLFVIDDGSSGASTAASDGNVVRKNRAVFDEDDRAMLVSLVHAALLGFYDLVIYTDADEFIVIDPDNPARLATYLRASVFACRAAIGLEVVHRTATEREIDLHHPSFEQREFVRFDRAYCKPVLATAPIRWRPGFHHCDVRYEVDCNLLLFIFARSIGSFRAGSSGISTASAGRRTPFGSGMACNFA